MIQQTQEGGTIHINVWRCAEVECKSDYLTLVFLLFVLLRCISEANIEFIPHSAEGLSIPFM